MKKLIDCYLFSILFKFDVGLDFFKIINKIEKVNKKGNYRFIFFC